ncbi:hypothetical protein C8F01DRAFT_1236931 [Mycena amicta]|nr:hypothetical protein C8F01DRAFT_1236931 [Mycena amicta]
MSRLVPLSLRKELEQVEDNIASLEAQLAELRRLRKLLLSGLSNIVYPILTLPTELTIEIFTYYVESVRIGFHDYAFNGRTQPTPFPSPIVLASVCRAWRDIALNSAALWCRLDISNRREAAIPALRNCLSRSATQPLSLSMAWTHTPGDVLPLLSEHSARWESFTFALSTPLSTAEKALKFDNKLPRLKSLAVEGRAHGWPQPGEQRTFAFSEAPLLETVYLHSISSAEIALPWRQVRNLTLRHLGLPDSVAILRQTPHLETLSYNGSHVVHAPTVSIRLEFLKKLTVVDNNSASFLQQVTLPALESLDIVFPTGHHSFSALPELLERSHCALRTLVLTNIWVEHAMDVIKHSPTIVELTLKDLRHDRTSGSGLLELALYGSIVPHLRRMRIECGSWEYMVPYLHMTRIVEARAYQDDNRDRSLREFCFILGTRGFQVAPKDEEAEHARKLELEREADDAEEILENMEPHSCRVVIEAPQRRLVWNYWGETKSMSWNRGQQS